jgi:hypothetical protein
VVKRLIFILALLMLPVCALAAVELDADDDGKIDVDYLPTTDFSVETDPASPLDGQIWWNEATKQLKVADALGIYSFNGTLAAWDTTPEAFSFTDVTNATTNSTYTSDAITVAGINHAAAISISGDASAKYSINNATAVSTNGTVESGDEVRAVVTSSADAGTEVNATVMIGGVSDVWSVTTASSATYLVNEDFEGTGNPSGWTVASNANPDFTDNPIDGLESLSLGTSSTSVNIPISTESSVLYCYFSFKSLVTPNTTGMRLFYIRDAADADLLGFGTRLSSDVPSFFLRAGSSSSATVTLPAGVGETNHVWLTCDFSTGTVTAYVSATTTKPGTATATYTVSLTDPLPAKVLIDNFTGAGGVVLDNIYISETDITEAP